MYYYVKNIQSDIIKIVNEDGSLAYTYDYDAWGALLSIKDNQGHTISGNSLATTNPLRYRGYVYDDETGLYYLQSRYYDPKTGRFLNADVYFDTESGSPLSTNMFAYCENCPLYKIDTNGQDAWWITSPDSAWGNGHASLLIQEKPGFWWYFYWGGESVQLLFLGTVTQANIHTKANYLISIWNYNRNNWLSCPDLTELSFSDPYRYSVRLEGNFTKSLNSIRGYLTQHSTRMYFDLSYLTRFYNNRKTATPIITEYTVLTKFRVGNVYSYNGKNYVMPWSYILFGNRDYNFGFYNCLQVSLMYLRQGYLYNSSENKYFKEFLRVTTRANNQWICNIKITSIERIIPNYALQYYKQKYYNKFGKYYYW